jgi:hypothetical protein
MTAAWPPGLPESDRIRHGWQCSRPPLEDAYRTDPKTGESWVERRCPGCGAVERKQPA